MNDNNITRSWLNSEVKFFLSLVSGIVVAVWGVAIPYFQIKQDIELIKQNHFTHIENIQNSIEALQQDHNKMQQQYIDLLKILTKQI